MEYILQVNKDPDEEVALEACEFWYLPSMLHLKYPYFSLASYHVKRGRKKILLGCFSNLCFENKLSSTIMQ